MFTIESRYKFMLSYSRIQALEQPQRLIILSFIFVPDIYSGKNTDSFLTRHTDYKLKAPAFRAIHPIKQEFFLDKNQWINP